MKKIKSLLVVIFCVVSLTGYSQMLSPEDPGGEPVGEDPLGGGAPLTSGTIILVLLGVAYGGKKTYELTRKK